MGVESRWRALQAGEPTRFRVADQSWGSAVIKRERVGYFIFCLYLNISITRKKMSLRPSSFLWALWNEPQVTRRSRSVPELWRCGSMTINMFNNSLSTRPQGIPGSLGYSGSYFPCPVWSSVTSECGETFSWKIWSSYFKPATKNVLLTCIQISQEAGQVVWYSHLFQKFPQFIVIYIVKGFGIVNKA